MIRRRWDGPTVSGAVARLAGIALARPHRMAAVVGRRIAKHVEEQAVDFVAIERFRQDRHRVLTVVVPVDTSGVQPVVDRGFTIAPLEEPFRMRIEDRLLRLAQIEAADHADSTSVRLAQHLAEQISPRWQERARVVKGNLRRILRDDAAHVDEEGICGKLGDSGDEGFRIDGRISLAQVRLKEPNRLIEPPQ
jgi:hypothetical protein